MTRFSRWHHRLCLPGSLGLQHTGGLPVNARSATQASQFQSGRLLSSRLMSLARFCFSTAQGEVRPLQVLCCIPDQAFPEVQVLQSLNDEDIQFLSESQAAKAPAQEQLRLSSAPATEAAASAPSKQVLSCALCTYQAASCLSPYHCC